MRIEIIFINCMSYNTFFWNFAIFTDKSITFALKRNRNFRRSRSCKIQLDSTSRTLSFPFHFSSVFLSPCVHIISPADKEKWEAVLRRHDVQNAPFGVPNFAARQWRLPRCHSALFCVHFKWDAHEHSMHHPQNHACCLLFNAWHSYLYRPICRCLAVYEYLLYSF